MELGAAARYCPEKIAMTASLPGRAKRPGALPPGGTRGGSGRGPSGGSCRTGRPYCCAAAWSVADAVGAAGVGWTVAAGLADGSAQPLCGRTAANGASTLEQAV